MPVSSYSFLAIFLGIAVVFPLAPLLLAAVWARCFTPAKPGPMKGAAFECGVPGTGPARVRFKAQYYHYGIVFLLFDVEAAFLLPFAVAFLELPLGAVLAMLLFVVLLAEGLVWAWGKGILQWK